MNENYHIEIEFLLQEVSALKEKLKIALQGLDAITDNGDLLGIAQKTLDALEKVNK